MIKDCDKCIVNALANTGALIWPLNCNLCRKGQLKQLEIDLADVFKEYQDLASVHDTVCKASENRIAVLEDVLRHTRGRLARKNMSTTAIDGALDKKGD